MTIYPLHPVYDAISLQNFMALHRIFCFIIWKLTGFLRKGRIISCCFFPRFLNKFVFQLDWMQTKPRELVLLFKAKVGYLMHCFSSYGDYGSRSQKATCNTYCRCGKRRFLYWFCPFFGNFCSGCSWVFLRGVKQVFWDIQYVILFPA